MIKVGDKVVVVSASYCDDARAGDILVCTGVPWHNRGFIAESKGGYKFYVRTEDMNGVSSVIVSPYTETEAEKRGAKFGTMGVNKVNGNKVTFITENGGVNSFGESLWEFLDNDTNKTVQIHPGNVRLDHEPEYKEIPFRNATDSQRLNVENIYGKGGKRPIEALKTAGGYYVYTFSENTGPTMVNRNGGAGIEIRIPA